MNSFVLRKLGDSELFHSLLSFSIYSLQLSVSPKADLSWKAYTNALVLFSSPNNNLPSTHKNFVFKDLFLFPLFECFACMYACIPSAWPGVLRGQKVELEMVLSCLPCAPYLNTVPLKEQYVLLTIEPCLQSLTKHFCIFYLFCVARSGTRGGQKRTSGNHFFSTIFLPGLSPRVLDLGHQSWQ